MRLPVAPLTSAAVGFLAAPLVLEAVEAHVLPLLPAALAALVALVAARALVALASRGAQLAAEAKLQNPRPLMGSHAHERRRPHRAQGRL